MSASLVGSEMCIRDRSSAVASASAQAASATGTGVCDRAAGSLEVGSEEDCPLVERWRAGG
eukprot:4876955-Alexandrium_andersonii.AAC.1